MARRKRGYRLTKEDKLFMRAYREDSWREQKGRCSYCREPIKIHQITGDHIKPRKKGGTVTKENIKCACESCNNVKDRLSEKKYISLLKNPPKDAKINLLLASFRYKLWSREELAEKKILSAVGIV